LLIVTYHAPQITYCTNIIVARRVFKRLIGRTYPLWSGLVRRRGWQENTQRRNRCASARSFSLRLRFLVPEFWFAFPGTPEPRNPGTPEPRNLGTPEPRNPGTRNLDLRNRSRKHVRVQHREQPHRDHQQNAVLDGESEQLALIGGRHAGRRDSHGDAQERDHLADDARS